MSSAEEVCHIEVVVLIAVIRRRTAEQLFEAAAEMGLVAEAGLVSDIAYGAGIEGQQAGGVPQAQLPDQLAGGPPQEDLEPSVELGNAEVYFSCQAFHAEPLLVQVAEDAGAYALQENMVAGRGLAGMSLQLQVVGQ